MVLRDSSSTQCCLFQHSAVSGYWTRWTQFVISTEPDPPLHRPAQGGQGVDIYVVGM